MLQVVSYSIFKSSKNKDPRLIKKGDNTVFDQLDYSNIEFPINVKQYNKIEKQNNIDINVFGYENIQPYQIYVSKAKFDNAMNLLLITDGENEHYVLIKDFNRFMFK